MTTNVIIQDAVPKHRMIKALVQNPDGNGGWTTTSWHQLDGVPLVAQVHGGQRIIIEEIDPDDHRMPVERLQPRASPPVR